MERLAGRFILLWGWRRALTAFLAGALAILGQAPYDFFAVYFISFPILVWLLDGAVVEPPARLLKRLRPAFAIGWWFGFGYFVAGLWWIGSAMLVEGDDFIWAIPIAVLVLPAILAVFYGLACALARMAWTDDIGRIVALAGAFGLFEWLRTFVLTGFPWNPIGYAAMPIPLFMQSVSVVGVVGMNILTVFVSATPALFAGTRHVRFGVVVAVLLLVAHGAFGYLKLSKPEDSTTRSIAVRIVQPAVNQAEKFDRDVRAEIFQGLLDLSKQPPETGKRKPQLIVWPETSVPFLFTEHPEALTALGDNLDAGQTLVAGIVRAEGKPDEPDSRYYNSVVAINDRGEIVDAVDKVHLVPGGEYLPLSDLLRPLGIDSIIQMPTTFTPGTQRHPVQVADGINAALFICYEVIFPDLVSSAVNATPLIINVTNDAWFGDTTGPYQHFRQAQLRAVETGRPIVRAANTGISAYIDPKGRVIDALAVNSRGVIDVVVKINGDDSGGFGEPRVNGLMILLFFMLASAGFYVRQRLRSN